MPLAARPTTACRSARTRSRCRCSTDEFALEEPPISTWEWTVIDDDRPRHDRSPTGPPDVDRRHRPGGRRRGRRSPFAFIANDPRATFECAIDGELFSECEYAGHRTRGLALGDAPLPRPRRHRRPERPRRQRRPDAGALVLHGRRGARDDDRLRARGRVINGPTATFVFSSTVSGSTFECALDLGPFVACATPYDADRADRRRAHARGPRGHARTASSTRRPRSGPGTSTPSLPETTIVSGPTAVDDEHRRRLRLRLDRAGRVRVLARRRPVRGLRGRARAVPGQPMIDHLAIELHARPRTRCACAPRRERLLRPDAGELHVDDRAGAADTIITLRAGRPDHGDERDVRVLVATRRRRPSSARSTARAFATVHLAGVDVHRPGGRLAQRRRPRDRRRRPRRPRRRRSTAGPSRRRPRPTPPDTTITHGAAATRRRARARRSASSASELGTTFECSLDGAPFAPCTDAGRPTPSSRSATHTFQVRATDAAGNVEVEPGRPTPGRSSTGDDDAAGDVHQPAPRRSAPAPSATFAFAATETRRRPSSARSTCRRSRPCTSPKTYIGLGGGDHIFLVRAIDANGNVDPSPAIYEWTVEDVDAAGHQLIESAGRPERHRHRPLRASPAPTTRSSSRARSRGSPSSAASTASRERLDRLRDPQTYTDLGAGRHTFEVRAVDEAGNVDPTPASYAWTIVDETPPETTIDSGAAARRRRARARSSRSRRTRRLDLRVLARRRRLRACTSPQQYTGLARRHAHVPRPRDRRAPARRRDAGELRAGRSWRRPTRRRRRRRSTPARPPRPASTSATLTFSANEPARPSSARSTARPSTPASRRSQLTDLAVGVHQLRVRATDAAGNADLTPAGRNWSVTPPPETTILTGPAGSRPRAPSATFTFAANQPGATFECALDQDVSLHAVRLGRQTYTGLAIGDARVPRPRQGRRRATSSRRRPRTAGRSAT